MSTLELQQLRDDLRALREFVDGIRPHVERARAQSRVDCVAPRCARTDSNVVSIDRFWAVPRPISA
jgi:hypothetical protein